MTSKRHLATVSILVSDRHKQAVDIQSILTKHGHIILARLGVNPSRTCVKNCVGIMALIVEGTSSEIKKFSKELDDYYGIVAKTTMMAAE